jgi:heme oxygenase
MSLYDATTDVHHDAQETIFGKKMAEGVLTRQEWGDWLNAMAAIHRELDPFLPAACRRLPELTRDLIELADVQPAQLPATRAVLTPLFTEGPAYIGGLSYVMCGANLRGGAVVRKALAKTGLPCHHLYFSREDAFAADQWLKRIREYPQLEAASRQAFGNILLIMKEISGP